MMYYWVMNKTWMSLTLLLRFELYNFMLLPWACRICDHYGEIYMLLLTLSLKWGIIAYIGQVNKVYWCLYQGWCNPIRPKWYLLTYYSLVRSKEGVKTSYVEFKCFVCMLIYCIPTSALGLQRSLVLWSVEIGTWWIQRVG